MSTKNKTGRPAARVDWDKLDKLLQAQCEGSAIAGIMGMHPDTLYGHVKRKYNMTFSAYQQIKRGEGKELLKAKMFSQAMQGDRTMLIWLSKQWLGMTDKHENILPEGMEDITVKILRRGDKPELIEAAEILDNEPVGGNGKGGNGGALPHNTQEDDDETT